MADLNSLLDAARIGAVPLPETADSARRPVTLAAAKVASAAGRGHVPDP